MAKIPYVRNKKKKRKKKKVVKKKVYHHDRDPKDECQSKTYFSVAHALLLTLQSVTGKQTHEIMNDLTEIQEKMLVDYELDPHKKSTTAHWENYGSAWQESYSPTAKRRTTKFPGTDINITCNLQIQWHAKAYRERNYYKKHEEKLTCDENTNLIHCNFYMPQRKITFDSHEIAEILMEGELFDVSEDVDELDTKDSLTPAEKRARAEAKKQERLLKKQQKELEKKAKTSAKSKK